MAQQTLRPIGDGNGTWTKTPSGAASKADCIDDDPDAPDLADYISSPAVGSVQEIQFTSLTINPTMADVKVYTTGGGPTPPTLTCRISYNNRASWSAYAPAQGVGGLKTFTISHNGSSGGVVYVEFKHNAHAGALNVTAAEVIADTGGGGAGLPSHLMHLPYGRLPRHTGPDVEYRRRRKWERYGGIWLPH